MSKWIRLEGSEATQRRLKKVGDKVGRKITRQIVRRAMHPVLALARRATPVLTGRLRKSLGLIKTENSRKGYYSARVGVRRDFNFVSTSSTGRQKLSSGRGASVENAVKKRGYTKEGRNRHVNFYSGGIHFGTRKDGSVARKAGGANFLNQPMDRYKPRILNTFIREYNRALENA